MADFSSLSFELDGIPKMLISLDEVDAFVARGAIAPDTRVTVYLSDRSSSEKPAVEHPMLAPIFARYTPPEPEEVAEVEEEAPAPAEPDPAPPAQSAKDSSIWQAPPQPTPAPAPQPTPQPAPAAVIYPADISTHKGGGGKTLAMLVAAVIIVVLLYKLVAGASSGADFVPLYVDDAPVIDSVTAAEMNEMEWAEQAQTYYLVRATNVRSAPNADAAKYGMLERGEAITGAFVPSQTDPNFKWLRLTDGGFTGSYVSAINIIENQPPAVDSAQAGSYRLIADTELYAGPSANGPIVSRGPAYLGVGQTVQVIGDVAGMAEIEQEGGGVAYIPWSAIAGQAQP